MRRHTHTHTRTHIHTTTLLASVWRRDQLDQPQSLALPHCLSSLCSPAEVKRHLLAGFGGFLIISEYSVQANHYWWFFSLSPFQGVLRVLLLGCMWCRSNCSANVVFLYLAFSLPTMKTTSSTWGNMILIHLIAFFLKYGKHGGMQRESRFRFDSLARIAVLVESFPLGGTNPLSNATVLG